MRGGHDMHTRFRRAADTAYALCCSMLAEGLCDSFFKFDFLALSLSAFPRFISFSRVSSLLVSFIIVYTVVVSLLSPLSHSVQ